MSYDIMITDANGKTRELAKPHQIKGMTHVHGENFLLEYNTTYNFAPTFQRLFGPEGIRFLYYKSMADTIPLLDAAIGKLGDARGDGPWECADGNVKKALKDLRALAGLADPSDLWEGD